MAKKITFILTIISIFLLGITLIGVLFWMSKWPQRINYRWAIVAYGTISPLITFLAIKKPRKFETEAMEIHREAMEEMGARLLLALCFLSSAVTWLVLNSAKFGQDAFGAIAVCLWAALLSGILAMSA